MILEFVWSGGHHSEQVVNTVLKLNIRIIKITLSDQFEEEICLQSPNNRVNHEVEHAELVDEAPVLQSVESEDDEAGDQDLTEMKQNLTNKNQHYQGRSNYYT